MGAPHSTDSEDSAERAETIRLRIDAEALPPGDDLDLPEADLQGVTVIIVPK